MWVEPATKVLTVREAVPDESGTVASVVVPSRNLTDPVGALVFADTVAKSITGAPSGEGFAEVWSVVIVSAVATVVLPPEGSPLGPQPARRKTGVMRTRAR